MIIYTCIHLNKLLRAFTPLFRNILYGLSAVNRKIARQMRSDDMKSIKYKMYFQIDII